MPRNYNDFTEACASTPSQAALPANFRKWAAISAVAGAMGRKIWYDAGAFKISSNMFVVLIAPPGRGKSLSLNLPILNIYGGLSVMPGVTSNDDDWNPLIDRYGLDDRPLYMISDRVTPYQIPVEMTRAQRLDLTSSVPVDGNVWESSVTLVTSEFGSLMTRDDSALQNFLTEMWDRKIIYSDKTKTSGKYVIKGPCLNWIACATPDQFIENLPLNARSQGLLSRLIPVYYDGPSIPADIHYGTTEDYVIEALREDLAHISQLRGEMKFADTIYDEVREEVRSGLEPSPTDPNLKEYKERRVGEFIKVAMSISASRRDTLKIEKEDWDSAKELMMAAEDDMPHILKHFGMSRAGRNALDLQGYVKSMLEKYPQGLPLVVIKQEIMRRATYPAEVDQTLKAMVDAGMLRQLGARIFPVNTSGET
jgi:hypothetical protein